MSLGSVSFGRGINWFGTLSNLINAFGLTCYRFLVLAMVMCFLDLVGLTNAFFVFEIITFIWICFSFSRMSLIQVYK